MKLVEISNKTFIPVEDIILIIDGKKDSNGIRRIKKNHQKNDTEIKSAIKETNSLVLTRDNLFYSDSNSDVLAKRCSILGYKFTKIDESSYVALSQIVLASSDSSVVSRLKKKYGKTAGDLQFVHQNEARKSVILLRNDQLVYLSMDSKDFANNSVSGVSEEISKE